jgi:hypothetical protein
MGVKVLRNQFASCLNAIRENTYILGLLILTLCNFPIWFVCLKLNSGRPLVNIDYIIPIIFIITVNRFWAICLLFVFQIIDLLAGSIPELKTVGRALALSDVLSIWNLLPVSKISLVLFVGSIPCLGVSFVLSKNRINNTFGFGLSCVIISALISVGDLLNGSSGIAPTGNLLVDENIAFSGAYRISKRLAINRTKDSVNSLTRTESVLQNYILASPLQSHRTQGLNMNPGRNLRGSPTEKRPHQVLFVLAESLGVLNIDPDRLILFEPLLALTNNFALELGSIKSTGVTIDAEKREFYGLKTSLVTDLKLHRESFLNNFLDAGYELFAFHNYYGAMYDRRQSLMAIGFKNVFFLDDFLVNDPDIELTGFFLRGATDRAIISHIAPVLNSNKSNGDRFVYWLTLSGHLPIDRKYSKLVGEPKRFENKPHQLLPEPVFRHEVIIAGLIDEIYKLISGGTVVNCDVIVVGDHAPPFGDPQFSGLYKNNLVPYLVMRCK